MGVTLYTARCCIIYTEMWRHGVLGYIHLHRRLNARRLALPRIPPLASSPSPSFGGAVELKGVRPRAVLGARSIPRPRALWGANW
jgi:hypothetical protein